jgi:polyketide synthase 12
VLKDAAADSPLAGVVHLGALGCGTASDASTREVQWTATDLCAGLLPLARALSRLQPLSPPKLVIPTRGAQSVIEADHVPAPWQAPVWGLGQTLRLEVPQCSPVLVDLDAADQPAEADLLGGIVLSALAEDRIALRGGQVYVPRLVDGSPRAAAPDGVALHTSGGIGGIHFKPLARRAAPGRGEIEIEVSHTALNYRDVLRTVGMLAGHDDALVACECAGTVARLGEGVDGLSVGDQVLAFMFSAPGSYTIVPAACAVPRPGRLTPAEAAAVPVAYVSAYHGLIGMARLQPGETVLIHSATGGMGMAAMEIARWRGATVYATAGTETKRDLLLKLGAGKVADSRSPDFARQLRAAGGTDVDVILNTLAGQDAKEANFALLSPFGRYIETARNEMHQGQPLPLGLLLPSRSFHSMDLTALHEHHPVTLGTTLRKVAGLLEEGTLAPPRVEVFPAEQAAEAMGKMMRAEHIGKLALKFPDTGDSRAAQTREVSVRPDATYLVVGGLSGVGGLFTDWLVGQGARHLLLTGRSRITPDASGDSRARRLARLSEDPGLEVQYTAVDVADEQAMSALLHERGQHGHPAVAGVVHSALSLRPAPLVDISETELDETLSPKVAGGWALHRLFRDTDLDFFVLFSSAVSLLSGLRLGSQLGAYAAANAFLDALGAHRRAQGLPATVVNWGYWADTGMAHRLSEHDGRSVRPPGILPISPHEAPELFTALLAADGVLRWMPADWPQYAAAAPADAGSPLLRELLGAHPAAPAGPRPQPPQSRPPASRVPETTGGRSAPAEITTAHDTPHSRQEPPEPPAVSGTADTTVQAPPATPPATPPAAPSAGSSDLETWLVEQLARVLDLAPQDIDATSPVNRLGIDSLLAAELTTRLRREHGHDVTVPRILKAPSLRALARELASQAPAEAPTAFPSPRGNGG